MERDGKLYIATSGGLVIFDPQDSSVEQFTNTIGLPSNFLTCLVFDSGGRIFVGTEDSGAARLEPSGAGFDVSAINSTFHGLSDDRLTSLAAWGDSLVYGTKNGAGLIINGSPSVRFSKIRDGLPSDLVNDVLGDGDRAWMATDSGVVFVDKFSFVRHRSNGLPSTDAKSFARTDTALWVGTADGVAWFNESDSTWVPGGLGGEPVFTLTFDGSKLWAGTRFRFYENNGSGWVGHPIFPMYLKYDINSNISEIRAVQPVANGNVYVGVGDPTSERRGPHLLFYDGATTTDLQFNAIPTNNLRRLSFDIDNSLWVSTTSFGVGKLSPSGVWLNYNRSTGDTNLSSRFFNLALLADSQGAKWFCTLSTSVSPSPLDQLNDMQDLDTSNDVWSHHFIDDGGGDGLGSLRSVKARQDPAGNRWFLSDSVEESVGWWGINILSADGTAWRRVNPTTTSGSPPGMMDGSVTDVAFGPGGTVYVAYKGRGVQEWRTGGYDPAELFDLSDDLWIPVGEVGDEFDSTSEMRALALRGDGILWIATSLGLYKWDPDPPPLAFPFKHFQADRGFGAGLLGNLVADVTFDHEDNLWVATDFGLNRINREDDNDIDAFTTPVAWQSELSLFYSVDVVSPLVNAKCEALAMHPVSDLLYIATRGGLSILDTAALKQVDTNISEIYFYPNPVRVGRGDTALNIANLNTDAVVEVYTIEGELVHKEQVSSSGEVWSLNTSGGFHASGGIYVVRVVTGQGIVVKTISLIR